MPPNACRLMELTLSNQAWARFSQGAINGVAVPQLMQLQRWPFGVFRDSVSMQPRQSGLVPCGTVMGIAVHVTLPQDVVQLLPVLG